MKSFNGKTLLVLLSTSLFLFGCSMQSPDSSEPSDSQNTEVIQADEARYEAYTSDRFDEVIGNQSFLLFFHADWCALCKRLEGSLKENLASLGSALILEANYDDEVSLKKEYGVTAQTTVLFFDEKGALVDKKINPSVDIIRDFFVDR